MCKTSHDLESSFIDKYSGCFNMNCIVKPDRYKSVQLRDAIVGEKQSDRYVHIHMTQQVPSSDQCINTRKKNKHQKHCDFHII